MQNNKKRKILTYAFSLYERGCFSKLNDAIKESKRWHEKSDKGLVEPLLCQYNPDSPEPRIEENTVFWGFADRDISKQNWVKRRIGLMNGKYGHINLSIS